MANTLPIRIKTINEFHHLRGLPKPEHPLISVINLESIKNAYINGSINLIFDFYFIVLKRDLNAKFKYGQQQYDFDEGIMSFMSPGQVLGIEVNKNEELKSSGWLIFIHPDFLWNTTLAKKIKQYEYFGYSVNEALYLSEKEEKKIISIIKNIQQEYCANIDRFSQDIIVSELEVLLNYSERFYNRQFITRKITNHKILNRLEDILTEYFNNDSLKDKGLPSVKLIAESLNISPDYLSGVLKTLTGKNTQQHIHDKLIDKAKEKLATSNLSVSEIAYQLGFEHAPSFSKLFKSKTKKSPLEFRHSFN